MNKFLSLIIGVFIVLSASIIKAEPSTINLADIPDRRVFQRLGGAADVEVSGTYTGSPVKIEYRIVYDGTNMPVSGHDWQTLESSPTEGIFSSMVSNVPEGGWYNIDVRFSNDTSIKDEGGNKWGVGILVGIIGQSNVSNWFDLGNDEIADQLLSKYENSTWSIIESTGNGAIAFGNYIIRNLTYTVPVGLLDYAVGGSALQLEAAVNFGYWQNYGSGPYATFISSVQAVGGSLEFLVWGQGENDAWLNAITEYETNLTNFVERVRYDVGNGSAETNLPFLISLLGRGTDWNNDNAFQAIRNAQENVVAAGSDIYLASTTSDLPLRDIIHYTDEAYSLHGERCAQSLLYLLGETTYHRGPYISSAYVVDAIHTDVKIIHRGGNGFTPASGITGFEIANNGIWEIPFSADQIDAASIRLTHTPISGTRAVRYLYGADPVITNPVFDNTYMRLPLEGHDSLAVILPQFGDCDIDPDLTSINYFQAEEATISSAANFSESGEEILGVTTQLIPPQASPSEEYILNFLESGTYYVWLLARSPYGSVEDNSVWYGLDGNVVGDISVQEVSPGVFPTYKNWINQNGNYGPQYAQINIPLPGTYVFNLWSMDSGFAIDAVGLTKSANSDFDNQLHYRYLSPGICSSPDSDGDGMADTWESFNGLAPYNPSDANYDSDEDGLANIDEYNSGTSPQDPDTDSDGIEDGFDGYPLDDKQSSCTYPVRNYLTNETFSSIQLAVDDQNAADYDIIQVTAADFEESILYDRETILILSGGYSCSYLNNPSTSSVHSLSIPKGKVIIDNLVIH